MTWNLLSLLNWTTDYFKKNSIESARLEAELLLSHLLQCERIKLYMQFDRPMNESELASFKTLVQRRIKGEPIAYIRGVKEFWSLPFKVGPGVLVPRPETEIIVERIKEEKRNFESILDIGTGSGILAIVLAKEFPSSVITAIDASENALNYARENAEAHNVADRIQFEKKDFLNSDFSQQFDLIISNPPYISSSVIETLSNDVKNFEPREALDGGADGLIFYRAIAQQSSVLLKENGLLVVEIGEDQGKSATEIFTLAGLKEIQVIKDYSGLDRVVVAKKVAP